MDIKWIGAIVVVLCCGWFGYSYAAAHRTEEKCLTQLNAVLNYMGCELQYQLTPLPELFSMVVICGKNQITAFFQTLSEELKSQISPDVPSCMRSTLSKFGGIPPKTKECLLQMGNSLGQFDLPGQLRGFEEVRQMTRQMLETMCQNKDVRLRSYQTLGLCAGAALVILFI